MHKQHSLKDSYDFVVHDIQSVWTHNTVFNSTLRCYQIMIHDNSSLNFRQTMIHDNSTLNCYQTSIITLYIVSQDHVIWQKSRDNKIWWQQLNFSWQKQFNFSIIVTDPYIVHRSFVTICIYNFITTLYIGIEQHHILVPPPPSICTQASADLIFLQQQAHSQPPTSTLYMVRSHSFHVQ